jgi:hypothetical protein
MAGTKRLVNSGEIPQINQTSVGRRMKEDRKQTERGRVTFFSSQEGSHLERQKKKIHQSHLLS